MANRTWLDVASEFIDRRSLHTNEDSGFTAQQRLLLQELLRSFGEAIGQELGSQLARLHDKIDRQASLLKQSEAVHEDLEPKVEVCRSGEVTGDQEATNSDELKKYKNRCRKQRRVKGKEKRVIHRSTLLRCRPVIDISSLMMEPTHRFELGACQLNTQLYGMDGCDHVERHPGMIDSRRGGVRPDLHGISGEDLAKQCVAVRCIQRLWRRKARPSPPHAFTLCQWPCYALRTPPLGRSWCR